MNYLIIYGNPGGDSFVNKVLETAIEKVLTSGNSCEYRNLYELGFNPVLSSADLAGFKQGEYPEDVRKEQEWIRWAEVILFIYPLWWGGMPAIMKGYIDRTFSSGFAYQFNKNNPVGLLKDKKAILISTQGYPKDYYDSIGMTDAMMTVEREGIFAFCGIEMTAHLFIGNAHSISEKQEHLYLEEVKQLMEAMDIKA